MVIRDSTFNLCEGKRNILFEVENLQLYDFSLCPLKEAMSIIQLKYVAKGHGKVGTLRQKGEGKSKKLYGKKFAYFQTER